MPTNTNGRIIENDNFEFPAVTLCNLNMARKSVFEHQQGMEQFWEFVEHNRTFNGAQEHLASKKRLRDEIYKANVRKDFCFCILYLHFQLTYSQIGHNIKSMLLSCIFLGKMCESSDFLYSPNPTYGICY
jgi:hypothetical protein